MALAIVFAANALLNLLLTLALSHALPAEAYGVVVVHLSAAVLTTAAAFDWTRDAALRFYTLQMRQADPRLRATLDALILLLIVAALSFAAIVPGSAMLVRLPLVAFIAVSYALVEYLGVIARCRGDFRTYGALVLLRQAVGFGSALPIAVTTESSEFVLLALGAAAWPSILLGAVLLHDRGSRPWHARLGLVGSFAIYAVPLTGAEALYQLLSFAARSKVSVDESFAAAGAYALSFDIAFKVAVAVAAAADAALLPRLVAAHEAGGEGSPGRLGQHLAFMALIVAPLTAGLALAGPSFAAVALPRDLQPDFVTVLPLAALGSLLYTAQALLLRPCFQIAHRTMGMLAAAAVAAAVTLGCLVVPARVDAMHAAVAQVIGLAAGLVVLVLLALCARLVRIPVIELGKVAVSVAVMTVAGLLAARLPGSPLLVLVMIILSGGIAYVGTAVALDAVSVRSLLGVSRRS